MNEQNVTDQPVYRTSTPPLSLKDPLGVRIKFVLKKIGNFIKWVFLDEIGWPRGITIVGILVLGLGSLITWGVRSDMRQVREVTVIAQDYSSRYLNGIRMGCKNNAHADRRAHV